MLRIFLFSYTVYCYEWGYSVKGIRENDNPPG